MTLLAHMLHSEIPKHMLSVDTREYLVHNIIDAVISWKDLLLQTTADQQQEKVNDEKRVLALFSMG